MSKAQVVNELHRLARKNFPRRRVIQRGIDDLWQADLVELQPYASMNSGYRYLLTVIDTFSKFAWAIPLKTKTASDTTIAMQSILNGERRCLNLQVDNGSEFYNKRFKSLMQKYDINLYSTFSNLKASIVERWNRTLKGRMWKAFSLQGTYKWITIIDQLVHDYNNTIHSTIKMKPIDVTKDLEKHLLTTVYNNIKIAGRAKLKVGDLVRISKYKGIFEKSYTHNWSTEIFKIVKVQITNPVTYLLEDLHNEKIAGGFYEYELQKSLAPDVYLVEKIIRKSGKRVYVKWLGLPATENSWIDSKDII